MLEAEHHAQTIVAGGSFGFDVRMKDSRLMARGRRIRSATALVLVGEPDPTPPAHALAGIGAQIRSAVPSALSGFHPVRSSNTQPDSSSRNARGRNAHHFDRTFGLPPGLPGGGIAGLSPVSGVGARISGSTPVGGHKTPSDSASLSPSGLPERPTVEPSGDTSPRGALAAQSAGDDGAAGAVCCGGVAGVGGACATAAQHATPTTQPAKIVSLHCISP